MTTEQFKALKPGDPETGRGADRFRWDVGNGPSTFEVKTNDGKLITAQLITEAPAPFSVRECPFMTALTTEGEQP